MTSFVLRGSRPHNRMLQRRADRMAVQLQTIAIDIAHEYPAFASQIDDASKLLGQLAAALPTGDEQ